MPRFRPFRAALIVLATAAATGAASAAPTSPSAFLDRLAAVINDYRAQNALPPLAVVDDLASLADEHSQEMAAERRLSHDGFRARMGRTDSRLCVENVAHNFPTPETLVEGWRRSPAHHRNLLEPGVSRMGLAATGRYVTYFACR
jgi:uncharacterized protein YkwD